MADEGSLVGGEHSFLLREGSHPMIGCIARVPGVLFTLELAASFLLWRRCAVQEG